MAEIPRISEKNFIYAIRLTNDLTHEYRYVGQTSRGVKRLEQHLLVAKRPNHSEYATRKYTWMRRHFLQVTFDIIEVVDDPELLNLCEMKWIHIFSQKGYRLTNHTLGGDGVRGHTFSHTEDAKQRISAARAGVRKSPETRERMSQARKGISISPHPPEVYQRIAEKNRGKIRSTASREKMSESMRGNTNALGTKSSDETKQKVSTSKMGSLNPMFGKTPSDSTIEKRRVTYHNNNHVAKNKLGPTCLFCLE